MWAGVRGVWLTHPPGTPHDTGSAAAGKNKNRSDGRHIHSETTTRLDGDRLVWRRPPRPPSSSRLCTVSRRRGPLSGRPGGGVKGVVVEEWGPNRRESLFFSSRRQDGQGGLRTRLCRPPHHLIRWMTCAKDSGASHTATWEQKSVSGRRMVGAMTGELEPAVGGVMQSARSQIPDLQRFPRAIRGQCLGAKPWGCHF